MCPRRFPLRTPVHIVGKAVPLELRLHSVHGGAKYHQLRVRIVHWCGHGLLCSGCVGGCCCLAHWCARRPLRWCAVPNEGGAPSCMDATTASAGQCQASIPAQQSSVFHCEALEGCGSYVATHAGSCPHTLFVRSFLAITVVHEGVGRCPGAWLCLGRARVCVRARGMRGYTHRYTSQCQCASDSACGYETILCTARTQR